MLANENVPGAAVQAMRQEGYDVAWVRTDAPGSNDEAVLARALVEDRILLTFDNDFGEIAFRNGLPATSGIVLVRAQTGSPGEVARLVLAASRSRADWAGHFSVVENDRIRMTALPATEEGGLA